MRFAVSCLPLIVGGNWFGCFGTTGNGIVCFVATCAAIILRPVVKVAVFLLPQNPHEQKVSVLLH